MKIDRIIWGAILVFVGTVILLDNFDVITFYWRNVWHFWPVFLIITGVNILFNRKDSQTGHIISLVILVLALAFLFYQGQQPSKHNNWMETRFKKSIEMNTDDDRDTAYINSELTQPFDGLDSVKKTILNISGGGVSFNLGGETTALINVELKEKRRNYTLNKETTDSTTVLTFKGKDKKNNWNFGDNGNDVNFKLNKAVNWNINLKLGAGEADFDFSNYKVRTFSFNGGAASLDIKFSSLLPITDVSIKSGIADVELKIPTSSGCRIKTKTGLSSKDFEGFIKVSEGLYETTNYNTSTKKIFINLDGGLSNFEVSRY